MIAKLLQCRESLPPFWVKRLAYVTRRVPPSHRTGSGIRLGMWHSASLLKSARLANTLVSHSQLLMLKMASNQNYPTITSDILKTFEKLSDTPGLYKMDEKTALKTGKATRMAEAAALRFVRETTSVPVPEVYDAYMREDKPDCGAIIMEFIEGDTLDDVWGDLDTDQKESIITQLKGYFDQLRTIKGDFIGSVDRSHCEDQIFSNNRGAYGPFQDEHEFREGCINAMYESDRDHWPETVAGFIRALPPGEIVFTHNDFHPRNIIVRDGKVVGIIDWELSGFYPEYWEYVKAWYRPSEDEAWVQERAVDKVLKPYPLAHAVFEHTREIVW